MIEKEIMIRDGHIKDMRVRDHISERLNDLKDRGFRVVEIGIGLRSWSLLKDEFVRGEVVDGSYKYPGLMTLFGVKVKKKYMPWIPFGYLEVKDD